jgi:hypothetical protein
MSLNLPIGTDDFKELILEESEYIDKTDFIKEFLQSRSKVTLITRPRRFGKSLNLSMVKYFCDLREGDLELFKDLKIYEEKEIIEKYALKYPVVYINLKELGMRSFDSFIRQIKIELSELYKNFPEISKSDKIEQDDIKLYWQIRQEEVEAEEKLANSLYKLTNLLSTHYNSQVIILMDEYDAAIQAGYEHEYYEKITSFMRHFMGKAMKSNPYLYKALVTGVSRISQASLFSSFNNAVIHTILSEKYAEYFGYTEEEIIKLLEKSENLDKLEEIKYWYNGYNIGGKRIYNPWSANNYLSFNFRATTYWSNTGGLSVVNNLIINSKSNAIRDSLVGLIYEDIPVNAVISEQVVFSNILGQNPNDIWNLLMTTGYLSPQEGQDLIKRGIDLVIPNNEIKNILGDLFTVWFRDQASYSNYEWPRYIIEGKIEEFIENLEKYLNSSVSSFNLSYERDMQLFILSLLTVLGEGHQIRSEGEAGSGRYDILIISNKLKRAVIIEIKRGKKESELEKLVETAYEQIINKNYSATLASTEVKEIILLGLAFAEKKVQHKYEIKNI